MYISAVTNGVILQLYLCYDFYKIVSEIKDKLYITSGLVLHPNEKFWVLIWA